MTSITLIIYFMKSYKSLFSSPYDFRRECMHFMEGYLRVKDPETENCETHKEEYCFLKKILLKKRRLRS